MKILNIFKKKSTSTVKLTNVQKLNTNQLEKVIGGAVVTNTTRSNTKDNY